MPPGTLRDFELVLEVVPYGVGLSASHPTQVPNANDGGLTDVELLGGVVRGMAATTKDCVQPKAVELNTPDPILFGRKDRWVQRGVRHQHGVRPGAHPREVQRALQCDRPGKEQSFPGRDRCSNTVAQR